MPLFRDEIGDREKHWARYSSAAAERFTIDRSKTRKVDAVAQYHDALRGDAELDEAPLEPA